LSGAFARTVEKGAKETPPNFNADSAHAFGEKIDMKPSATIIC